MCVCFVCFFFDGIIIFIFKFKIINFNRYNSLLASNIQLIFCNILLSKTLKNITFHLNSYKKTYANKKTHIKSSLISSALGLDKKTIKNIKKLFFLLTLYYRCFYNEVTKFFCCILFNFFFWRTNYERHCNFLF